MTRAHKHTNKNQLEIGNTSQYHKLIVICKPINLKCVGFYYLRVSSPLDSQHIPYLVNDLNTSLIQHSSGNTSCTFFLRCLIKKRARMKWSRIIIVTGLKLKTQFVVVNFCQSLEFDRAVVLKVMLNSHELNTHQVFERRLHRHLVSQTLCDQNITSICLETQMFQDCKIVYSV